MRQATLILTFSADAVFSARPATLGGHSGLDYIPGAAVLGWAASKLYGVPDIDAFTLFHSGRVRFSNGYPLTRSRHIAFPVPQALIERKRERDGVDKENLKLVAENLRVQPLGQFEGEGGVQAEPLRNLYVSAAGEVVKRDSGYRMKTAIKNGRSAESELFGYEHLKAGRQFVASIEADDEVPEPLFKKLIEVFENQTLSLGRSRQSEYGGEAACQIAQDHPGSIWPEQGGASSLVTLLLLSDLALEDENGAPSLAPDAQAFGLRARPLSLEKSIIATRRYSPFNGYLRRPELERSVIAAGSVLRYEYGTNAGPIDSARGFGLYREAGLGRMWINPPMLKGEMPAFVDAKSVPAVNDASEQSSDYAKDLLGWLDSTGAKTSFAASCDTLPEEWFREVEQFYKTARAQGRAVPGPSSSQWGRIKTLCHRAKIEPEAFRSELLDGGRAICKGEAWTVEAYFGGEPVSLQNWVGRKLKEPRWVNQQDALRQTLGKLAERARALSKQG
jgi:hypothetical protein